MNNKKETKLVHCIECQKEIEVDKRSSDKQCKCDGCRKYKKVKKEDVCLVCGHKLDGRELKYCSYKCQRDYQFKQNIEKWKSGILSGNYIGNVSLSVANFIKKYLFQKNNNACEKCGWSEINNFTKKIPLTIHHKNNNPYDTREENLELLCPNCHSLTESYGGSNKGKGRKNRKH